MNSQSRVRKIRTIHDEATGDFLDEYSARGLSRRRVTALISREATEPREVSRPLRGKGADLPRKDPSLDRDILMAMEAPAPLVRRAAQVGWYGDPPGVAFVARNRVLGISSGRGQVIPPAELHLTAMRKLSVQGTAKQFRSKIAPFARYSSVLMLAMGAAFGAPILAILGRQSFGLVLFGKSRGGKSSALLASGSILGFGAEDHLPSLNATPAGLLSLAEASTITYCPSTRSQPRKDRRRTFTSPSVIPPTSWSKARTFCAIQAGRAELRPRSGASFFFPQRGALMLGRPATGNYGKRARCQD